MDSKCCNCNTWID